MPGRRLCPEENAIQRGFGGAACARRRQILQETVTAFLSSDRPDHYHQLAKQNLDRWRKNSGRSATSLRIEVIPEDWGVVAQRLTSSYGHCFAVLNMANAYSPGGAYVEGAPAQEENMFRRTDCHFRIREDEFDPELELYRPDVTKLLSAHKGAVYLDVQYPRVCIRGPEDRSKPDLGYPWLPDDQVFPFFELRAAACDLRDGSAFDPDAARRRISAQLDTLRAHHIRHAVLGAFGCGAFLNPAQHVAQIYYEEILARAADFSVIAFPIISAGYGPDNFQPFANTFCDWYAKPGTAHMFT